LNRQVYPSRASWRDRLHEIIFEADTPRGKLFDVVLLIAIVLSVVVVSLESVESIREAHGRMLIMAEWFFTIVFTIEYILRLICVHRKMGYALSFFGIVDLLTILPMYLSVLFPGAHSLAVIRALRLLRVFRIFKLARFLSEAGSLWEALIASRAKITVFLTAVVIIVVIMATAMHLIEGSQSNQGFSSIPQSMYWAVVTVTTVGYGDATPQTPLGKMLAAIMMIIGYCLIIIPGGIVSAEWIHAGKSGQTRPISTQVCRHCSREGHDRDAAYCKFCGEKL
jgi:voltage-gated potassium channel